MQNFTSTTHSVRLHSGDGALGLLPKELDRIGARRVFVVCSNSVASKTPLLSRIKELIGARFAGAFTQMRKDAPMEDAERAAELARDCAADSLIAVGAGSVMKGTRAVAIAIGEGQPLHELATRYPDNGPPVSPKLLRPKPAIFNVPTVASSAQNRAGCALRRSDGGPRLEFFDPKTRPVALFWDVEALLSAPPKLAVSTGLSVFWRALMNAGAIRQANPLVQASRLHAYTLSRAALGRIRDPVDAEARLQMCAAALLQNRDEDDGGRPFDAHWIARVVYALAAALFNRVPALDQGSTHAVLTGPAIRHFSDLCPDAVAQMGVALGLPPSQASQAQSIIDHVQDIFRSVGVPDRLAGISGQDRASALEASLFNFNADRNRELGRHRDRLLAVLEEAS